MGKKKDKVVLGRTLLKAQSTRRTPKTAEGFLHTSEINDGNDWAKLNLRSVTEQTNIDDFLETAQLAGTEFTAEKENIKIISNEDTFFLLTESEKLEVDAIHKQYQDCIRIPRRPKWDAKTTAESLGEMERENFLEWRRSLAELQEKDHILMTPYEKNLEFWRQLWRVVERSDVVVQILDARNPLLFRCEDLEKYVKEVDSQKLNVLLLNKADHLTSSQREIWGDYFKTQNIEIAFFSAIIEEEEEEEEEENESEESAIQTKQKLLDVGPNEVRNRKQLVDFFRKLNVEKYKTENVLTVGLVGYPNVGKSSTINCLLSDKKVSVSATPGKTKHFQTLLLSEDFCLCDCPGLVFPSFVSTKAEMIVNGILPIDQMTYCLPPMALLANMIPKRVFEDTYGITLTIGNMGKLGSPQSSAFIASPDELESEFASKEELLNAYGYARGFMTQRGLPDISRAARLILKDYVNGKLLYCVAPPGFNQTNFHQFPVKGKEHIKLTPAQLKLLNQDKIISQSIEDSFFKKVTLHAHKKLKGGNLDAIEPAPADATKPWKKHHNKHKREKLRRVYSDLDNDL